VRGTITVQLCLYLRGEAFLQGASVQPLLECLGCRGGAVLQCPCCPAAADLLLGAAAAPCQLQTGNESLIEHIASG
jgi:hypothetical protein